MTDPTTFPPLQVRDYPVQWDWKTNDPNLWDENTHYERAVVELPNGFRASIVRTNRQSRFLLVATLTASEGSEGTERPERASQGLAVLQGTAPKG